MTSHDSTNTATAAVPHPAQQDQQQQDQQQQQPPQTAHSAHPAQSDAPRPPTTTEALEELAEAEGAHVSPSTSRGDDYSDPEHGGGGSVLEKVQSEKPSIGNVASIPNGGTRAWLQVLGSFFLMVNCWGVVNTFGVYQTYYESGELFHQDSSAISWIGSIQAFLLLFFGALSGPIYDTGRLPWLIGIGSFLVVFGHMMLSLASTYWQALLAQGFCVGLGAGLLFVPSVAIISSYFTTHVALAMGLAAAGSSVGGVLYPIVLHRLIGQIGFAWSVRVLGFMALAMLAVPNLVLKMRVKPGVARALIDWSAFREPRFVVYCFGSTLGFMGLYTEFFYVQYFSISRGITDPNLGFYLLAILNSASVFGRILPNMLADTIGPMNTIVPCAVIAGVLQVCLIATHSLGGVVVQSIFYGFFSGSFVSLPPTVLVYLTPNRALIGTRMGMAFGLNAIGVLIGPPIAGAILGSRHYFNGVWLFGGLLVVASGLVMGVARVLHVGPRILIKA